MSLDHKRGVLPIEKPERRAPQPRRPLKRVSAARARQRRIERREAIYLYGHGEPETPSCWLRQFASDECDGRPQKAHLIPKQIIRREVWEPVHHGRVEVVRENFPGTLKELQWDRRVWRFACFHHHYALDFSMQIVLARTAIPASVEEYAREYGLTAWLDRNYGVVLAEAS